jgi:hypothetical protein
MIVVIRSGERTRPRVPISAPRRNASLVKSEDVVGEAPTAAREARALPGKISEEAPIVLTIHLR